MMEKGAAVPMDLVAVLLELCHDHRQDGVDEIYKHKTAMGYAMQLGQHDLVEKVGNAWMT